MVTRFGYASMTCQQAGPHTVLTVGGELDVCEAPGLLTGLRSAIAEGRGDVVLHLPGLAYFDSTCLGALVAALKELRRAPGSRVLRVVDSDGPAAKSLRICELTQVIYLYDTVAQALQAADAPTPAVRPPPG